MDSSATVGDTKFEITITSWSGFTVKPEVVLGEPSSKPKLSLVPPPEDE